jgi:hypothetical protein
MKTKLELFMEEASAFNISTVYVKIEIKEPVVKSCQTFSARAFTELYTLSDMSNGFILPSGLVISVTKYYDEYEFFTSSRSTILRLSANKNIFIEFELAKNQVYKTY